MTIKIHITDYRNESTTHLKGEHFEKKSQGSFYWYLSPVQSGWYSLSK